MSRRKWTRYERAGMVGVAVLVICLAVLLGFMLAAFTNDLLSWVTET